MTFTSSSGFMPAGQQCVSAAKSVKPCVVIFVDKFFEHALRLGDLDLLYKLEGLMSTLPSTVCVCFSATVIA